MYYVYLLMCSDNSIYCGITDSLEKRLKTHNNAKGAKYTRTRLPVRLIYSETAENKSAALKREYEIKKYSRKKKLELINKDVLLSENLK